MSNYIILRNVEKNSKVHWEYRKFLTRESVRIGKQKEKTSRLSRRKINQDKSKETITVIFKHVAFFREMPEKLINKSIRLSSRKKSKKIQLNDPTIGNPPPSKIPKKEIPKITNKQKKPSRITLSPNATVIPFVPILQYHRNAKGSQTILNQPLRLTPHNTIILRKVIRACNQHRWLRAPKCCHPTTPI